MKKKVLVAVLAVTTILGLTGCGNKDLFDTNYTFDRAIIALPNGEVVEVEIDKWTDYEDGDQIQVKINGITYLVHSSNIVLIAE
jgi:ABC-type glycerol-3-phosphate transport system substrate-binding protein